MSLHHLRKVAGLVELVVEGDRLNQLRQIVHTVSRRGILAGGYHLRVRACREVEVVGLDATSSPVPGSVGVDGEEQVGAHTIGELGTRSKRHVGVTPPREDDLDAGLGLEPCREAGSDVKDERRFSQPPGLRPGIVAPMPRVDHDSRDPEPKLTAQ